MNKCCGNCKFYRIHDCLSSRSWENKIETYYSFICLNFTNIAMRPWDGIECEKWGKWEEWENKNEVS